MTDTTTRNGAALADDGTPSAASPAAQLIARSNRLGADPRNTNYAGGNTSAKGAETDPVTGEPVELLWVKGSGGDLGTLTEKNLAVLRSEEHTSELQSRQYLVCRLLLEKKINTSHNNATSIIIYENTV